MKLAKALRSLSVAVLFAHASIVRGAVYLADDFNDGVIDSTLWQASLPFGQSSLIEANGYMTMTARGTLGTVNGFTGGIIVAGQFRLLDALDQFKVSIRSDLSTYSSYAEITGITVGFANDQQAIRIDRFSSSDVLLLGTQPFGFNTGQTYQFAITDDGSQISVDIDGNSLLSVTSSFATGNQVAFFNREFGFNSSQFDNVSIVSVPEPSATALSGAMFIIGFGFKRLRRALRV